MLQANVKINGKRTETLIAALRQLATQLEEGKDPEDPDYLQVVYDKAGTRIDGTIDVNITGKPISYGYFARKGDEPIVIINSGYPSAAYCFASASKYATEIRVDGNPNGFTRVGIIDDEGRILSEYENSSLLEL